MNAGRQEVIVTCIIGGGVGITGMLLPLFAGFVLVVTLYACVGLMAVDWGVRPHRHLFSSAVLRAAH